MVNYSSKKIKKSLYYLIITLWLIITVYPFLLVVTSSFQSEWAIKTGNVMLVPIKFTIENYRGLFLETNGGTTFLNSLINSLEVSLGVCVISILLSVLGAYGLSRYNIKGKEIITRAMLFMYVFPAILAIFPIYNVLADLKLTDTHIGLILVNCALVTPFCTWLLRSFFDMIPKEIEEAAFVDGASRMHTLFRIIIPLAAPGILAAGMYALIYSWGEYMFTSIIIDSSSLKTIPLSLQAYVSHTDQKWGRLLAGVSMNFVPLLLIFVPLSNTFLKGFMAGAVKS